MSDTVAVAIIVALTGIAGPPLVEELRDWFRRRRMSAERRRKRQLRALEETREQLGLQVEVLQHTAVGATAAAAKAQAEADALRRGSLWLVGQADPIRAYQDLLIHLQNRFGQTIRTEDVIRSQIVLGQVSEALAAQEELANRGKHLRQVAPSERAELGDVEAFATRLLSVDRLPSVVAREARLVVRILNWWKRWRGGGV